MNSGKKWRSTFWLNAMNSGQKWCIREFAPRLYSLLTSWLLCCWSLRNNNGKINQEYPAGPPLGGYTQREHRITILGQNLLLAQNFTEYSQSEKQTRTKYLQLQRPRIVETTKRKHLPKFLVQQCPKNLKACPVTNNQVAFYFQINQLEPLV